MGPSWSIHDHPVVDLEDHYPSSFRTTCPIPAAGGRILPQDDAMRIAVGVELATGLLAEARKLVAA